MKKKLVTCLILVFCLTPGTSMSTHAFTKDLAVSKQSGQWQVKLGEAKGDHNNHLYNRYNYHTLTVKNVGKHVSNVEVTGFKDAANVRSNVMTRLSDKGLSKGYSIKSNDFPLFYNTNKFIVVIFWTDKNNGKKHRDKFVFTE